MTESNNERKKSRSSRVYIIMMIVFAVALIVVLAIMIGQKISQRKNKDIYENLTSQVNEPQSEATEQIEEPATETEGERDILAELGIEIPEKNLDWKALWEENEDIYAWIYIPETNVDYPVLQDPDEDNYYLTHNLDGSTPRPGCIYSQVSCNTTSFMDYNTVLYGHNMSDQTMFATLHYYEDKEFFDKNKYIYIYTPEQNYVYEVFGAYHFSDDHLFYKYDLITREGYEEYLDMVLSYGGEENNFRESSVVDADHHILTLSTCTKGRSNERYLIQGVLINDPTLTE